VSAELKRAVDAMNLEIDMSTVQITGGARGYRLDTIKADHRRRGCRGRLRGRDGVVTPQVRVVTPAVTGS
jgi:hypothetical protein